MWQIISIDSFTGKETIMCTCDTKENAMSVYDFYMQSRKEYNKKITDTESPHFRYKWEVREVSDKKDLVLFDSILTDFTNSQENILPLKKF